MEAAVVDLTTNIVINKIVADAAIDSAPDGTRLVDVPEGTVYDIGWSWDGVAFIPPVAEEISGN